MKKYLLISILALCIIAVNAQTTTLKTISPSGGVAKKQDKSKVYPELSQPSQVSPKKLLRRQIQPVKTDTIFTYVMGSAGNALGSAYGSRTNLWYDPNINTIAFFHRSDPAASPAWPSNSDILYDYSTDQGLTWNINQGPLYDATSANTLRGRYPQGVIYNPSGNTTPTSASATAYGPITNGTIWVDNYKGTSLIGASPPSVSGLYPTQRNPTGGYIWNTIPDGAQIVKNTGTVWIAGEGTDFGDLTGVAPGPAYDDSVFLAKGTFNTNDFTYDFSKTFYAYVDTNSYSDIGTAWSDDGTTGYIVMLGNDENPVVDSVLYPIIYKTTNGGDNWTKWSNYKTNMNINVLDPILANGGYAITTAFDVDCGLDKNNNLHIAVSVGTSAGGFSISTAYGNWGVFDIYNTNGDSVWYAQLLGKPEELRGEFGANTTQDPYIDEDNRPQVTRSWDGSKIFISWFDTDTAEFGGGNLANLSPDWHLRGYDVDNNLWTDSLNMTDGTPADGFCTFANCSYYSISTSCGQTIPLVYGQLQQVTSTGESETFYYVANACVADSSYNLIGQPCLLVSAGSGCSLPVFTVGINELAKRGFDVSDNYPNPFTGSTMVDVTLTKPEDVTIEVSDMLGQVLSTKTYNNLYEGKNHLTITESDLAAGIYLYKVVVGSGMVAHTMAVK